MKNISKITLSAIMASLSTAFMLFSYFPYLTYAIPAISGLFIMILVIEINKKWAFGAYVVSSFLVFLFAEPESKLLYILFLGYYPIVKALIERINKPLLEWIIKVIIFNISILITYFVFSKLFQIDFEDFNFIGKYSIIALLVLGNIVFVLYDIAVSRMAAAYINVLHSKIKKFLK